MLRLTAMVSMFEIVPMISKCTDLRNHLVSFPELQDNILQINVSREPYYALGNFPLAESLA